MQLKIQRSQRASITNAIVFCLDVRADYSPEEQSNIRKFRLGSEIIYSSKNSQKHIERANAQFDRTQSGSSGERAAGLARGVYSFAMAKMSLNINIGSLGRGHHIECKDLEELLGAEDTVRAACKNVTRYLEVAATFDGSETVIEYEKGEEKVHVTQNMPPLLVDASNQSSSSFAGSTASAKENSAAYELGIRFRRFWANPTYRKTKIACAVVGLYLTFIILHYIFY